MTADSDKLRALAERLAADGLLDTELLELHSRLFEVAKSLEDDDPEQAEIIATLANIAGMMLDPTEWATPYSPLFVLDGKRSILPGDLAAPQLAVLGGIAEVLPPCELRARIADMCFLRSETSDDRVATARAVVENRRLMGVSTRPSRSEIHGWGRAVEIAIRFRFIDDARALESAAVARALGDGVEALYLSAAIRRARLGRDRAAELCEHWSEQGRLVDQPLLRREYLSEAGEWARRVGDASAWARAQKGIGDSWWHEALGRREDSALVARGLFGSAHAAYKAIPRLQRDDDVSERLAVLPRLIREAGEASLDEMSQVSSGPVDTSTLDTLADRVCSIDDTLDAIAAWFTWIPLQHPDAARESAEEISKDAPLLNLFPRVVLGDDGRVLRRIDPEATRDGIPEGTWASMVENHWHGIRIVAVSYLAPVLNHLSLHHKLSFSDFEVFCRSSHFVAPDQRWAYAKALYLGYYGRTGEALYLLAPTIEACVRSILQSAGVETRSLRADDTEIEPGLSTLIDVVQAKALLGPELHWEIKTLFCGPLGPNLRNRVAHGLLDAEKAHSDSALWAWWLAFRLAFVPYYKLVRESAEASDADATDDS